MIKKILSLIALALMLAIVVPQGGYCRKKESFKVGEGTFLLNDKPFIIKAAEVHYPRIPYQYWEHRIQMCKALGMNTLCLYIFWNIHEQREGEFDFTGNNDIRSFVKLAQKHGMYVIVRPGPYVCAEWEMGGLPWWLLKKKDISLRDNDSYFLERLKIFENKVGEQLGDLTIENGGPIIMVQVENEYGSYGVNKEYIANVRDIIRGAGFDKVTLFQCDWSSNFTRNALDDLLWTVNFGAGANIKQEFRLLGELRPNTPMMCSEFWSGWFDKWGGAHETRDSKVMVAGLEEMIQNNISFSLYMTHGGSNWGHWAGANSPGFAPDVTSYDYDAPINEYGLATPKYHELRAMLAKYSDKPLPEIPEAPMPIISIPEFEMDYFAPMFENLPSPVKIGRMMTMEEFDQGWGSILYRTIVDAVNGQSLLQVFEPHDYAQVFINGDFIGAMDRRVRENTLVLPSLKQGDTLDILVEAMGRINFGRAIKDFKGITDSVVLNGKRIDNWMVYNLPDDYKTQLNRKFSKIPKQLHIFVGETYKEEYKNSEPTLGPGYYYGTFNLKKVGDTFINMESWGKGQLYINGYPIGRFWKIGPQQTLYVPGCWLKKGKNEIVVVDIVGPEKAVCEGLATHEIDKLNISAPRKHRKEGQNLDLTGVEPVKVGQFAEGNGWQELSFDTPVKGRYLCIEALSTHSGNPIASIAEWYMVDKDRKRVSREPWVVLYADSEDTFRGNRTADKIFDLQESTYWSSERSETLPYRIVIDLGVNQEYGGFHYLPRVEEGAPGSIKGYKIYLGSIPFAF